MLNMIYGHCYASTANFKWVIQHCLQASSGIIIRVNINSLTKAGLGFLRV